MKKLLTLTLAFAMMFSLAACGGSEEAPAKEGDQANNEAPADNQEPANEDAEANNDAEQTDAAAEFDFKIGIMTGTVSQNEEEYRAAENVVKKYGEDHVIVMTYPDKFMDEQETTISNIVSMASDPDVKAIIICQAVPGTSAGIEKAKEIRDDILFIAGTPGEDPTLIAKSADIVLNVNEPQNGVTLIEQAKAMGAKTFVHYSFPRHMGYAMLSKRRDILKEEAKKAGIEFVEATAPDPTGDAGTTGAQQFILEDVPKLVKKYGKETAFFSTNCAMQVPLIQSVVKTGALYPQPCCPSPYHAFPQALEIEIPDDKKGDVQFAIDEITKAVADKNMTGRLSTWPKPVSMMYIQAGAEYAIKFGKGETDGKFDKKVLTEECEKFIDGAKLYLDPLVDDEYDLPNYLLVMMGYLNF